MWCMALEASGSFKDYQLVAMMGASERLSEITTEDLEPAQAKAALSAVIDRLMGVHNALD